MAHHRERAPDKAGGNAQKPSASLCGVRYSCLWSLTDHDKGEHRTKRGNAERLSAPP